MTAGFEADADRLAVSSGDFDSLAVRAAAVAERLERALDGAEEAWGDDAAGRSFAASHVAHADETLAGLRNLSTRLTRFGGTVGAASGRYRGSEEDAEQAITDAARE
ncbi:hypothetical protein GCM10027445_63290 [Amycolatopsis endophytica]|uniref:Signal transduction histidine kinase n=1 Tax=Amycolatopsis endophytica TaxID=860233 RepID=A0A853AYA6_9PSEU|nr:hypothetical protein [Amycolatopsis endophytica]NYI87561.1 signal transduction histidine kinase [Amycolatopsis endophytica]